MTTLRSRLIHLAHSNPSLRGQILPLLKQAAVDPDNLATWVKTYEEQLKLAIQKNPEKYAYGMDEVPAVMKKFTQAFEKGGFNHESDTVKATCRVLGIKHTKTAIKDYLNGSAGKTAGCEKLPEGGMRDNCEAKKEEGKESADKKASSAVIRKTIGMKVRILKQERVQPVGLAEEYLVRGSIALDFGEGHPPEAIYFGATVLLIEGSSWVVTSFGLKKTVSGGGADVLLGVLKSALQEALRLKGKSLLDTSSLD
jgi:hypothetical protein